mgnify:CR=1 FL=1
MKAWALKLLGALLFLTAVAMWLSRAPDWPVEALVARWAPPPSDFIELEGQLVHLRDVGPRDDAEPLVLIRPATHNFTVATVPPGKLVVHGEADEVVPLAATLDWARPQSQPVVVVPGGGHFFHGRLPLLKDLVVRHLR